MEELAPFINARMKRRATSSFVAATLTIFGTWLKNGLGCPWTPWLGPVLMILLSHAGAMWSLPGMGLTFSGWTKGAFIKQLSDKCYPVCPSYSPVYRYI
jgi:hypothetical protein